jgi:hypothetical protein
MGQTFADKECSWGDFTVGRSNPSGTVVRFTAVDPCNLLTTSKTVRMVLADAIDQFIADERADLDANGDSIVKGSDEFPGSGDGFSVVDWNFDGKFADIDLTSFANIDTSTDITVETPYADVI